MLDRGPSITRQKKKCPAAISSNTCLPWHLDDSSVFCDMVTCGSRGLFMNRLLILGILIISTAPLFAQAQQPNAAELAQKVVSIISGDKVKIQTYCQILDLSDELDQADQQKDREKTEELSQKINELQKNLATNTSRCSRSLSTWIQIPKTVRRSCRPSLSSIIPAGNGDVLIRGLTSLGTFRRSSHMGFNRRKMEDQRHVFYEQF